MAEKPTYQELEQRIKELEEESVKRKLAEKSLKESEEKFRQMFETMNNGVAVYEAVDDGKDFIFKDFNAAGERIDDVKRETIIGKRVTTVFPGVEEFSLLDVFKRVWQTGKAENHPISFYKDDRLTGWRENFVYKLRSGEVVAIYEDITERKRAEKALRESEEKYRSMMESMKDEAYICSSDFRIQYMNPATVGRIGRDATGELCYSAIYGLDEECSWCISDEILQGKNVEYELLNPNNNRYYSISNSPIPHIDGSISKLAVCRDITDVKKMELQLQQANKMEAIGTLAGGIAHQFNNVLSVITGNIDLLEMDFPGDETVANYTRAMKDSARRMTQLTTQLLAYARGGKFHAKTVLFSDFVRETLPLLKHTWGSAIDVDTDLLLGIMNVKVDLTQMQMVLSAVLTNASEAMEGKGRIRVTCIDKIITDETVGDFPGLTPGNYVNLTIVDDGKGMDKETRTRIFEPFFTTKFQGRGLGMAATYGIVKNHGGWISVDSVLGQGTTVNIYLPAVETPAKEDAKPKPKTEWIKGTGTILVIEDEEPVMKISRTILERLGYRVLEAGTGQEAIDVVKTFDGHIDLALLDILLPDMSGNDILSAYHGSPS